MKALFDTNILIDYLSGNEAARRELAAHRRKLVSIVTVMEIQAGARTDAEGNVVEMFLRDFTMVELDRRVAREAVDIRRATKIRLPDAIIWATARVESSLLVTRNTKDFPANAPGVRVPY